MKLGDAGSANRSAQGTLEQRHIVMSRTVPCKRCGQFVNCRGVDGGRKCTFIYYKNSNQCSLESFLFRFYFRRFRHFIPCTYSPDPVFKWKQKARTLTT